MLRPRKRNRQGEIMTDLDELCEFPATLLYLGSRP